MSSWIQEVIETVYRFITFLATVPFARRLLISDRYEYDYTILAPLAMTKVPSGFLFNLPKFPKQDELPDEKWVSIVLAQLSIIQQVGTTNTSSAAPAANRQQVDLLKSINREIKSAKGKEDLNRAVFKLKSALVKDRDEVQSESLTPEKNIAATSDLREIENRFDAIDREIHSWLNQNPAPNFADKLPNPLKSAKTETIAEVDKELYQHLREIARELGRKSVDRESNFQQQAKAIESNPTLADYEKLIAPLSIKPASLSNFQQDKIFAYQQVAGPNPLMLAPISQLDARLQITDEQYQNLVLEDSLETALKEGRLYLADYAKLGSLVDGNFGGIQKYIYAPVALFAVPPDNRTDRNLLPISIRCQQSIEDDNPIFTPLDGDNWMTAKTILQMADSNYHELISHLAHTHLFIEPFVLATNRCFTDKNHFVRQLLKPHLEGTILINYGAHKSLLAPAGAIDSLLSATIDSNNQLAIKAAQTRLANFNQVAFPKTLAKRGVNSAKQLPIYPYRDDGQRIWDAIHQWVRDYLGLFYRSDNSLETDSQLQNWASELLSKGFCHIGEAGDGRIKTLDYLVDAISTVIFTASAQHAAVNFPQSGLMTYAPAFPLGCYSSAPTNSDRQQNFMELLPPIERAQLQVQVLYLLGSVYYTKLGDYSDRFLQDTQVKIAWDKFKVKLAEIESAILQEDSKRLVSYRHLLPSKIPQSINI